MYIDALQMAAFPPGSPAPGEFRPATGVTIVCGRHGAGKTHALRLLGAAAAQVLFGLLPEQPAVDRELSRFHMEPAGSSVTVQWEAERLRWPLDAADVAAAQRIASSLRTGIVSGEAALPLLAFYGAPPQEPATPPPSAADPELNPRLAGYLDLRPSAARLETLADERLSLLRRTSEGDALPQALRALLSAALPPEAARQVSFVQTESAEGPVAWSALPGGARRMAALVLDLATRAMQLNPQHGPAAPSLTSGLVLIEAIEAQLHPLWQRRVLEDLRRVFPRLQFVLTTYSPFIVQAVADGTVLDLDGNREQEYGHISIEDIAETVLGVDIPQRSKRYRDMFAAASEVIRLCAENSTASEEEKARARTRMDRLTMPFSTNQAFMAVLAMERMEAGIDDDADGDLVDSEPADGVADEDRAS